MLIGCRSQIWNFGIVLNLDDLKLEAKLFTFFRNNIARYSFWSGEIYPESSTTLLILCIRQNAQVKA